MTSSTQSNPAFQLGSDRVNSARSGRSDPVKITLQRTDPIGRVDLTRSKEYTHNDAYAASKIQKLWQPASFSLDKV